MIDEVFFERLQQRILDFYPVRAHCSEALRSVLRVYHYPKTEFLIRSGKKPLSAWFILEGYVREIIQGDLMAIGHTSWFWFPGDFVFAYPVFFNQKETISDIEVLAGSILLEISYSDLTVLKINHEDISLLIEEIRFYYEMARFTHSEDLFLLSGKQRYQKFYQAHPALFNVARQKDIASFLGIKDIGFRRYFSLIP